MLRSTPSLVARARPRFAATLVLSPLLLVGCRGPERVESAINPLDPTGVAIVEAVETRSATAESVPSRAAFSDPLLAQLALDGQRSQGDVFDALLGWDHRSTKSKPPENAGWFRDDSNRRIALVDWLKAEERKRNGWGSYYSFVTDTFNGAGRAEDIRSVARAGRGLDDPVAKIRGMIDAIWKCYESDDTKVCRHFTKLFNVAMGELGHASQLHTDNQNRHTWSRVEIGGDTYIVDPMNNTFYRT